ncbi:protein kinase domain-containing protein [Nonomuraea sp. PA05]|uniref:protein kinase domain-containing protein n=1 Tax=Nonomuraea sp. PA05 TaxID=2604466 RepID=UPI0016520931|nr:serine/threonine-protein kinase [Nonomuraea sp. PA05]
MSHPPPTELDPGRSAPPTELDLGRAGTDEVPPTVIDAGREPLTEDAWGAGRLPTALAGRLKLVRELVGGSEALLFLVTDPEGRERILKIYRAGHGPDPEVSEALARLSGERHLVEVYERGTVAGRAYELMEHLAGGDLRTLLGDPPRGLPPVTVTEIVRQVAGALNALHAVGVPHRDLKPDNLLLRSREPLELAVIDFGISRVTDGTEIRDSRHGTVIYMAPEQLLARRVSPAVDWWALGMTLLELSAGRHPYGHLADAEVMALQHVRDIDFTGADDERVRLLLRGLLTKDAPDRWGAEEVAEWLKGGSPPVVAAAMEEPQFEPYDHRGRAVTGRRQLAQLLAGEWDSAAAYYFTSTGVAPPWQRLRGWIARLGGDPDGLFAAMEANLPPDVKLLRLVRWLDPTIPALYRNEVLTLDRVTELARKALGGTPGNVPDLILQLWNHRLLLELARAPLGGGLAEADARWRESHVSWQALTARLRAARPDLGEALAGIAPGRLLPHLLALATSPDASAEALRQTAGELRADLPHDVPWFSELTDARAGPLDRLCALLLEPAARIEAADLHAARVRRAWLLREEATHLWYRNQDRPIALGWAAAGCCLVAVFWVWLIVVSDLIPIATTTMTDLGWLCAIVAIVLVIGVELAFAAGVGGPYHPAYSLIGGTARLARAVARPVRGNGWLGLAVVGGALLAVLAATAFLPPLLPIGTVVVQVIWTVARQRRWVADEEDRADQLARARREQQEDERGGRT